ncbi:MULTISPECIES: antitoxin Xre/MbcA/ParS toxin-binding domain-containing protein [unclassified Raoultella]|uniref:type II RES/Xre toxin-antitoxin system antitoxin n=1 Tax=unclassified Raoultella TaxID=2627600 RepID=UPI001357F0B5|nr:MULTISPECIES: antitoxin Xre/MbcA/ParS toxin-binding domain-containing protein [unclassified Raoultella]
MKFYSPTDSAEKNLSPWHAIGLDAEDGIALMGKISHGLEGSVARQISAWAEITPAELRKMSGIANTTFNRSIKSRFSADQSERLVRILRVIERAVELFEGDKEAAQKWMNEPNRALGWKTPAEVVSSETGALEVMRLITRVEHGVYS